MRSNWTLLLGAVIAFAGPVRADPQTASIRPAILDQAMTALASQTGAEADRRVIVVDYGLHSSRPRLFVWDQENGEVLSLRASHGRGSDPDHDGYLDRFSSRAGSHASPEGSFRIGESYIGQHGVSLRLDGLDTDNANARDRAIVIHAADYAEPEFLNQHGKLGRSHGCIVLSEADFRRLRKHAQPGTYVFVGK